MRRIIAATILAAAAIAGAAATHAAHGATLADGTTTPQIGCCHG
jgi:hypothetical protein